MQPENGYNSDHLDESEDEKPKKKRKMTKAAEAKAKAAAKAKATAKKKKDDDDDFEDNEEEDPYNALSKMWKDTSKPPVGSFETCARCDKQFTVVCTYLVKSIPYLTGGYRQSYRTYRLDAIQEGWEECTTVGKAQNVVMILGEIEQGDGDRALL